MDLLFDTASDWLAVEGGTCINCSDNKYDITENLKNGYAVYIESGPEELSFGSETWSGRTYTDTFCLDFSSCVHDFEFFLIEE